MTVAQTARLSAVPGFALKALGLSLILAASAHINVPFWPVPMTLQTFAVLMIGGVCGARLGVAAMLAYLAEGALGLPVFAPGALISLNAGYLVGMVGAIAIMGLATSFRQRLGAVVLATVIIYAVGAGWLATFIGVDRAWAAGVLPFLAGDAAKAALALALTQAMKRLA